MDAYTVSGCIVTYNNMRTIHQTVQSLLEETTGVPFQLYVVDNHSQDGTPEYIRQHFPQVTVIENGKNSGFGAGHNLILQQISSKYHVVINPDIVVQDDIITQLTAYLDMHADVGLVSPRISFPDGRMQVLGKRDPKLRYLAASRLRGIKLFDRWLREYAMLDELDTDTPVEIQNASGCFMVMRTDLFRQMEGFDTQFFMYFEDCDLSRRMRKHAKVKYYPQAVVFHEWGRESKKNLKLMIIQIFSMFHYFWKWRKD